MTRARVIRAELLPEQAFLHGTRQRLKSARRLHLRRIFLHLAQFLFGMRRALLALDKDIEVTIGGRVATRLTQSSSRYGRRPYEASRRRSSLGTPRGRRPAARFQAIELEARA
jgi:hypothetical protein